MLRTFINHDLALHTSICTFLNTYNGPTWTGSLVSPHESLLPWAQSTANGYIVEFHPSDGTGISSIFTEQCGRMPTSSSTQITRELSVPLTKAIAIISTSISLCMPHLYYSLLLAYHPQFLYIASEANLANPISHRELGPPDRQLPTHFKLPKELCYCFTNI